MADLHLALKGEYFDAIKARTKGEEFRLQTPYWHKRLVGRAYDCIVLTKGYPARGDAERRLVLPWRGYRATTITHPHFGPDEVAVFAIDVRQLSAPTGAHLLGKIEPRPPAGIKYMLGDESWLPVERRTARRLHCEEWGNLGPMELAAEIPPNKAGLRVRTSSILAPEGALGFTQYGDDYYWTDTDEYGRDAAALQALEGERNAEG